MPSPLPPHLADDPEGLAVLVRQAERQHDLELAVLACEALAQLEVWGPILRLARSVMERAEPRALAGATAVTPPPWNENELHPISGYGRLARYAYNSARLLAPMSGRVLPPEPGAPPERVPNPMRLCVRALTSWYPGGWLRQLRELLECESIWRTDLGCLAIEFGQGPMHHVVPLTGRMICGEQAPLLAWLPDCICVRDGGRRGTCPHCQGKPARQGEMCVCVAGRCPRCRSGPKFTRENKRIVLSTYAVRSSED